MKIDFSSFEKALQQLEKSVAYFKSKESQNDADLNTQFRAAVIQAFEYSFELSWKFLKRHLEMIDGEQDTDQRSKKDLFRIGFEKGLIENPEAWFEYLAARNQTVHTYDEKNADEVCTTAIEFLPQAKSLLQHLKKRNMSL